MYKNRHSGGGGNENTLGRGGAGVPRGSLYTSMHFVHVNIIQSETGKTCDYQM